VVVRLRAAAKAAIVFASHDVVLGISDWGFKLLSFYRKWLKLRAM
jgi:hypothetical protein